MQSLLAEKQLQPTKRWLRKAGGDAEARATAQARTRAVLDRLDPERKGQVLRFLHTLALIVPESEPRSSEWRSSYQTAMSLDGSNLRGAYLGEADLSEADLSGADLSRANLSQVEGVTDEKLESHAKSLKGATMPDGKKHD